MSAAQGLIPRAREYARTPAFSKLWRYAMVSVVSTVISLALLYFFFRVVPVGSAARANVVATAIATVPNYYLNRNWVWGKTGRSHLMKEIAPFWVIAFVSLLASTAAVDFADREARLHTHSHSLETLVVEAANFLTYGILWVAKFVVFNKILFKKQHGPEATTAGVGEPDLTVH